MKPGGIALAMIGCGGISHAHARAAQASGAVRFVTCASRTEEKARLWAAQYGCQSHYASYEEMLQREAVDGVVLATWPNQHREQVEGCLERGVRNILCEKALTMTGADALQIWEKVQDADAFLMEGFMYRHHPAIRRIEQLASRGLGTAGSIHASFSVYDPEDAPPTDAGRNWRQRKECGGGVPYDLLCYCVNACQHFAGGRPLRVYCRGGTSDVYGTINRMYGLIEYDSGCVGIVESSKRSSLTQELRISCAGGILTLPTAWTISDDAAVTLTRGAPWPTPLAETYGVRRADSYQLQLENFAAVIRGTARPVMPLAESVENTCVLEALVTSVSQQGPVDVVVPEVIARAIRRDGAPTPTPAVERKER
jgi:predicted dehydrogenase